MATLGSGTNAQPFTIAEDYDNWLKRLGGMVVWMDQAIVNMREGAARGVVQPRPVMEKVLVQLEAMVVERPEDSLFFAPIRAFPEGVAPPTASGSPPRTRRPCATRSCPPSVGCGTSSATSTCQDTIHRGLERAARRRGLVRPARAGPHHHDLSPEEIHQVGLGEGRAHPGEMDEVRRTVGFEGDLEAFFTHLESDPKFYFTKGEDLLAGYRELKVRIDAALPRAFSVFPKADYELREVEAFRAQSAAGAYYQQPSPMARGPESSTSTPTT